MIYDPKGPFPQILVQIGDELPEGGEYWGKVVQGENILCQSSDKGARIHVLKCHRQVTASLTPALCPSGFSVSLMSDLC
jgi:hypothetical protein